MTNAKQSIPPSRFNAEEHRTLDAIGTALKQKLIDFRTAAELSDMIKTGRVDDRSGPLKRAQHHF